MFLLWVSRVLRAHPPPERYRPVLFYSISRNDVKSRPISWKRAISREKPGTSGSGNDGIGGACTRRIISGAGRKEESEAGRGR